MLTVRMRRIEGSFGSLRPFRLPSVLSAVPRPCSPPFPRRHGRWSPLAARSVLPGPGGRAQRAPEPARDGLRAGDLGGGAGRGRGAGAAAAGAARGPRGARPGGVHGPALRQPERAPGGLPAAAGAGGSVRRPHSRRGHPAAPRLLLRPPRRHRAAAGARRRPRGRRRRRQNRPAQGGGAGAPRALRAPPAAAAGARCAPRCAGSEPAGRGAPGREGSAGRLRGRGHAHSAVLRANRVPPLLFGPPPSPPQPIACRAASGKQPISARGGRSLEV